GAEERDEEHPHVAVAEQTHAGVVAQLVEEQDGDEDGELPERTLGVQLRDDEGGEREDEQRAAVHALRRLQERAPLLIILILQGGIVEPTFRTSGGQRLGHGADAIRPSGYVRRSSASDGVGARGTCPRRQREDALAGLSREDDFAGLETRPGELRAGEGQ